MPTKKTVKTITKTSSSLMDELLKTQFITPYKKNSLVKAKIVNVTRKSLQFDLGAKANAVLGDKEIGELSLYLPYLKVGDLVEVRVVAEESKEGYPVVSMRNFFERGKWNILLEKREKEEAIEVMCGEYGKGGVFIDFMGIRGVIPKIQLIGEFLDEPEKLTGQKVKVKVLEVDEAKNRLVVSLKAATLNISQKDLKEKFSKIEVGGAYKAKVLGVSEFGIFCEVDGVEGLVHISEISWEKVTDASRFVRPGQEIEVKVVEKNETDAKLNLSMKRLQYDPWESIEEKYPKDKELKGEVVRKERYGYFVRLEPGIEGLIHISKLAGRDLEVGNEITVFIERVNKSERRLSLVLPQTDVPMMYR